LAAVAVEVQTFALAAEVEVEIADFVAESIAVGFVSAIAADFED